MNYTIIIFINNNSVFDTNFCEAPRQYFAIQNSLRARERVSSTFLDHLSTRPQKVSPALRLAVLMFLKLPYSATVGNCH
jgi:hypothetical protein